jgi:hypothetical protein
MNDVEKMVRQHLAAFARGDFESWGAQLAPKVFFTAADPEEVFLDRQDAVAEMHKDFDPAFQAGMKLNIEPQDITTRTSPDGKAAWSGTPLQYTVTLEGETTKFQIRHTDVLEKNGRDWSIVATKWSLALPEGTILPALAEGRLPQPRSLGNLVGAGAARNLAEVFTQSLNDLSKSAIHKDAFAFGPLPR